MEKEIYDESTQRVLTEKILEEFNLLTSTEFVQKVFDAMPFICIVLNKHRQIVYANELFQQYLGLSDSESIVGAKPGEVFGCIHSKMVLHTGIGLQLIKTVLFNLVLAIHKKEQVMQAWSSNIFSKESQTMEPFL